MQTPLEQGINQAAAETEEELPAAKRKRKKRTNHQPALDMTQNEPEAKKRKVTVPPVKTTIASLLQSYATNLIDFNIFKAEMAKLKQALQDMDKFIELICPPFNNRHMTQIKKVRDREDYLQWTIDEIEAYCTQLSQEQPTTYDSFLIKNILNCIGYEHLNLLIERPVIKQPLTNNYAYELISFLHPYLSVPDILAQYFPGELGEQLKTKNIHPNTPATFLDLLYTLDPIATFDYWKQGFRPISQIEFNLRFFYLTTQPAQLSAIYQEIFSDDRYSELRLFPSHISPWRLFLKSEVINPVLFQQLIEKTQNRPSRQEIKNEINWYPPTGTPAYIQKIIYCISLLPEPLTTPADVAFVLRIKSRLPIVLQPRAPSPQAAPQISDEWLQQHLIADATEADEIFFYSSSIILNSRNYGELTNLWDSLKDKQGQPQQLFKSCLLACLLAPGLSATSGVGSPPFAPLNVIREEQQKEQVTLKQMLTHFAAELSATERSQVVESLVNFSYSALIYLANKQPLSTLSLAHLNYFAQFNSVLINLIPETTQLSPQSYYPISRILYALLIKMEQEQKAPLPKTITTLVNPYILSENRRKCLGTLFSQIIMSFSVNPNGKNLCLLMDQLTNLEPSWLNYSAQEVQVQGQNRNLFTSYSKLFSTPNLAQHAAEVLAYLLEKIRDNEQVILPEQFLKEIAEWQLNLQKKAQLNEPTQTLLEAIYNHCIHKTQNTPQEKAFEEIRTQLLIKFNANPTQEAQAIHSRENHEFSELIYSTWMSTLGETEALRSEKIAQGQGFFRQFIVQKKAEIIEKHLHNKDREFLLKFPTYMLGVRNTGFDAECETITASIKPYHLVLSYLNQVTIRSKQLETPATNVQQRQRIHDAQKLINLIHMIAYYSKSEQQAPEPFRINDNQEALNILLLEIIDQANNPSCDQGPFMRLLIALEPAAEYRFPFLTRRSIQFYINDYINAFYAQQSEAEQKSLLREIHAKIEDKETPGDIDYLPEHAFSFLASRFLKEYESRMGHITAKEIELLFSMERPPAYHPLVVTDLNQYHQEQRAALLAQNPNRFFMTHASQGNESSAMDVDVQPTHPSYSPQNL